MKTEEVAKMLGVERRTASLWAKNNGVKHGELINSIWAYEWTEDDIERFRNRNTKVGKPKGYKKQK